MNRIPLWPDVTASPDDEKNAGCPSYTPYLLEGEQTRPLMIVFPGGGYGMRAAHEAEPIALWMNRIGASAIVVNYRVAPYRHPVPLQDAQRAIRLARHRAAEWKIDPQRIGILGFSAGGHLVSTAGTHFDGGNAEADDPIERMSSRPDLMVLCYPVISLKAPYVHQGSLHNLLGDTPDPALVESLSNDEQVTADTPPTFLWHTFEDGGVPVENSLRFAAALARHKVPHELHVYEAGGHGLGLGENSPGVRHWTQACEEWLKVRRFL